MLRIFICVLALLRTVAVSAQSVSVSSPANGSVVSGAIQFAVSLTSLPSTALVEYWLDGELFDTGHRRDAFQITYISHAYPDTTHTLYAVAKNALGTILATSSTISFQAVNAGGVLKLSLSGSPPYSGWLDFTITNSFTTGILCAVDGEPFTSVSTPNFQPSDINTTNDTITIPGHGLYSGKAVLIDANFTLDGQNVQSLVRWAIRVDESTIKLATSRANAIAGTAGDISTQGSGSNKYMTFAGGPFEGGTFSPESNAIDTSRLSDGTHILRCRSRVPVGSLNRTTNFATTTVNTTTGNVNITAHNLMTGRALTLSTTGSLPSGWTTSTTYYAIRIDDDNFKIATSLSNAQSGTALIPSTQGSGTHSWNITYSHPAYSRNADEGVYATDYQTTFVTSNGASANAGFRTGYYSIFKNSSQTASLTPLLVKADGSTATVTNTLPYYSSDLTSVATVSSSGVVTCAGTGTAKVTATYLGFKRIVYVHCDASTRFFHITKSGSTVIRSSYDAPTSIWLRTATGFDDREGAGKTVGALNSQTEAIRGGFNAVSFGFGGFTSQPSYAAAISPWNTRLAESMNSAGTNFAMVCTGDDWTDGTSIHKIVNNTPWSMQTYTTQVLNDLGDLGGCRFISFKDEVDGSWGPEATPNDTMGGPNWSQAVVTGCAATPCVGTITFTSNYTWGNGVGSIIRVYGATNTAMNRYYQITSQSGTSIAAKSTDLVNGTYNSSTDSSAHLVQIYAPYQRFNTLPCSPSVAVVAVLATATCTSHGLSNGMWLSLRGASDADLDNIYPITVVNSNSFTFPVQNVTDGTYASFTSVFRTLYPDITSDIFSSMKTVFQGTTGGRPVPAMAGETIQGNQNSWSTAPFSDVTVRNVTSIFYAGRNKTTLRELQATRVEFPGRQTGRSIDQAHFLIVSWSLEQYLKQLPGGCNFQPGVDQIEVPSLDYKFPSAAVMSALSLGYSGVKLYAWRSKDNFDFDCTYAVDQYNEPSARTQWQPSMESGNLSVARSVGRAFRLIKRFEKYALSPNISPIDLGPDMVVGAKERTGEGRLLIITNYSDIPRTETIDITGLKYGLTNAVYSLRYNNLSFTTLADGASYTGTWQSGETKVLFFPATAREGAFQTAIIKVDPASVSGGSSVVLSGNHIWSDYIGASPVDCGTTGQCSVPWDPALGDFFYRYQILNSSGAVISESSGEMRLTTN